MGMVVGVLAESFLKNSTLIEELKSRFSKVLLGHEVNPSVDALIIGRERVNAEFLKRFPKLKWISKYGVGLDQIDFSACAAVGVEVLFEPGVNLFEVAEHTLGLMIGLLRNLFKSTFEMRNGIWNKSGGIALRGARVGLIGFGNIGQALGTLLSAFQCHTLVFDKEERQAEAEQVGARQVDLKELLSKSQVISLHLPLTEETRNFIGVEKIAQMAPGTFLLNTARGEVVDFIALEQALRSGKLAGAAFDVFPEEPYQNQGLLSLPGFFATPHTAGNSQAAVLAMGRAAINCLEKVMREP